MRRRASTCCSRSTRPGVPSVAATVQVGVAAQMNPAFTPVLANPGNRSGLVGLPVSFALSATDPNGDSLGYAASGLPPGVSIDPATGVISGQPSLAGTYDVIVAASDGLNAATASFLWTAHRGGAARPRRRRRRRRRRWRRPRRSSRRAPPTPSIPATAGSSATAPRPPPGRRRRRPRTSSPRRASTTCASPSPTIAAAPPPRRSCMPCTCR